MVLIAGAGGATSYHAEEIVKTQATVVSNRLGGLGRGAYNANRALNVATNDQITTELGAMAPQVYDPEWIAWLSGDI